MALRKIPDDLSNVWPLTGQGEGEEQEQVALTREQQEEAFVRGAQIAGSNDDAKQTIASALALRKGSSGVGRANIRAAVYKWNIALAVIQGATAVVFVIVVASLQLGVRFPLYVSLPDARPSDPSDWEPSTKRVGSIMIGFVPFGVLVLSALQHAATLVPQLWTYLNSAKKQPGKGAARQPTYIWRQMTGAIYVLDFRKTLVLHPELTPHEKFQNPYRWLEYMLSVPLMHFTLALVVGLFDVHLLVTIILLIALVQLLRLLAERFSSRSSFWIALAPLVIAWLTVLCFFATGVVHTDSTSPWYVWTLVFLLLASDILLAVNQGLMLYNFYNNYYRYEVAYFLISLISKQGLAWVLFIGLQTT